jgi:geranyl-CoA carboxylase alpha subunit
MRRFDKVLIANRGEIAIRVIRSAKKLGYRTVAIFSDADRDAPHVAAADEAVHVGASPAKESYLAIDRVLAAAKAAGANAIHPGYGFLSENEDFARACKDAGIVFIGPTPEAVELMGNKRQAKLRMIAAGVPCIPGYEGADQGDDALVREALRIGLPVMVKAAAGGGGRGMRLVRERTEIEAAIRSARSEAENAFGSGELILEKAVVDARHVEIQVFADAHGNAIHLGERDCSVQRRHQKVVEESPSPAVDAALRRRMGEVAVTAAKAIAYVGAGTIEFLLAPSGEFYFMEMNTRLQVEHPVTEMITGLDLVAWQLAVAAGERLPLAQEDVRFSGHAIEVRLCAEDPSAGFLPQTGTLRAWSVPEREGVRVDHGVRESQEITPFYDSMQAKVIAHAPTREAARRKLVATLRDLVVLGVATNKDFLVRVLEREAFARGAYDTGFVAAHFPVASLERLAEPTAEAIAIAAALVFHGDAEALGASAGLATTLLHWNNAHAHPVAMRIACGERAHDVHVTPRRHGRYDVAVGADAFELVDVALEGSALAFTRGGVRAHARSARDGDRVWLAHADATHEFVDVTFAPPKSAGAGGDGRLVAPMNGRVLHVNAREGDAVTKGRVLVVMEAMKMELQIEAAIDGVVKAVSVAVGDQVSARQLLVAIEPPASGTSAP